VLPNYTTTVVNEYRMSIKTLFEAIDAYLLDVLQGKAYDFSRFYLTTISFPFERIAVFMDRGFYV
jgi:hypothetical protein